MMKTEEILTRRGNPPRVDDPEYYFFLDDDNRIVGQADVSPASSISIVEWAEAHGAATVIRGRIIVRRDEDDRRE